MIVSYWQSLLVTPDFHLGSSILNIPLHRHGMRTKNFIQLQYARQYLFQIQFLFREEFQTRGTDETFIVETAVCPM